MQCRACLKTSYENTTRFDEVNIKCFNLITNLCIHMEDSMPQQLCEICSKDLQFCIDFREKCITSNSILLSALTSIEDSKFNTQIKQEDDLKYDETNNIEMDSKLDIEVKGEYDLEDNETLQSEVNFLYEYISDVKPCNMEKSSRETSVPTKERTRKMAPRVVKKKIGTSNKKEPAVIKIDCGLCTEKVEKVKLCDHLKNHESNKFCGICSLYFNDWETLLYHRISHLQDPNIICHICLRVFQNPITLEHHYNIKHLGKIEDGAKCRLCNKNYVSLKNLKKHRQSMHNDNNKTYKCKVCSEIFYNPNALQYHRLKSHVKSKIWFCNECDYKSRFNSSLRRHKLRIHTPDKVCCKLCRAMFTDESRFKRHKCQYSTHSVCPVCGIVIEVPKKMKEHLATHSEQRKYKCDRCDAAYKSRDALRVHQNKHDGVRTHKCEYCPAAFFGYATLVKHRRVHTGEKPYVCKVCNKGFTANHNLKVHMRVHGVFNLIKKKGTEEDVVEGVQECNNSSTIENTDTR